MLSKLKFFTLSIFLLSSLCEASRITPPPGDPNFRCSEKKPTVQECQEDRDFARETNCITEQELNDLIKYNGCPSCDRRARYTGWCPQGCFVRGTKIFALDLETEKEDWFAIEEMMYQSKRFLVAAVESNANLKNLKYKFLPIRLTTQGPELEPLVILSTNKRTLGITSTHGVMLANGKLVAAGELRAGDELLSTDSSVERILSVKRPLTDDLVFNLSVDSDDPKSHLIFVEEGLVVGDQFLQSSIYLNTTLMN